MKDKFTFMHIRTLLLLTLLMTCPSVLAQLHRATKSSVEVSDSKTFEVKGVTFTMISVQSEDRKSFFYLGESEVTQELWEAVMGNNPSKSKGKKKPVEQVSIDDCKAFIKKLNSLTGAEFRLPKMKEWLFACSGGNHSEKYKYSGSDNLSDVAWIKDNSKGATHEVKNKRANELGLYDMHGNVDEFCFADGWDVTQSAGFKEQLKKMDALSQKMVIAMSKTKRDYIAIGADYTMPGKYLTPAVLLTGGAVKENAKKSTYGFRLAM